MNNDEFKMIDDARKLLKLGTMVTVIEIKSAYRKAIKKYKFLDIKVKQTLFALPDKITKIEPTKNNYGDGGFVGICANKK